MKLKTSLLFLTLINFTNLFGQVPLVGSWEGTLSIQGMSLRVLFHVESEDGRLSAKMDSPDQGVTGIPVATTTYTPPDVRFEIPAGGIVYEGKLSENEIVGIFTQGGMKLDLVLQRQEGDVDNSLSRPQEPIPPFPYKSEEVSFLNEEEGIRLFGTLTMPEGKGPFPAVVLITGSGPQNRDSEILGHKPFLVISDYLTRKGLAVLRYDERGVGESEGDFDKATSFDFAADVKAAVSFLATRADINTSKIGLIGHSEGGMVAPMVAANSDLIAFLVLMAGPGLPGDELLLLQQQLILSVMGMEQSAIDEAAAMNAAGFELVKNESLSSEQLLEGIKEVYASASAENRDRAISDLTNPWMINFIRHDPTKVLVNVKCPVLAINGDKDLQVPAHENIEAIAKALKKGGNQQVTTKIFESLNHLFQHAETGSPMDYVKIEETFSEEVMEFIANWIWATAK